MAKSPTNRNRAGWAHAGLQTYGNLTGVIDEDLETQMSDLVGDLMHLARLEGVEFEDVLRRGEGHFSAEVAEEKPRRKNWDPRGG